MIIHKYGYQICPHRICKYCGSDNALQSDPCIGKPCGIPLFQGLLPSQNGYGIKIGSGHSNQPRFH